MSNYRLLEDGTSKRLLQDGSSFRVLQGDTVDAAFYSAIVQLAESFRNVRDRSLSFGGERKPIETSGSGASAEAPVFDPAQQTWQIDSQRVERSVYWTSPWMDLVWRVHDPRLQSWTIDSQRMVRTRYWTSSDADVSWLTPVTPVTGWTASSDRASPVLARWDADTNLDNAWIYNALPVVVVFDPALFPGIAELVGWRTPNGTLLALPLGGFVYDLSWVHDVIPLTDPVTGTVIHIRPIAPIMNRRRHRRRR